MCRRSLAKRVAFAARANAQIYNTAVFHARYFWTLGLGVRRVLEPPKLPPRHAPHPCRAGLVILIEGWNNLSIGLQPIVFA